MPDSVEAPGVCNSRIVITYSEVQLLCYKGRILGSLRSSLMREYRLTAQANGSVKEAWLTAWGSPLKLCLQP